MSRLVDRLLTLARADAGLQLQLAEVDLSALVQEVCRQSGRAIEVETTPANVDGDEDALRQLMWILLDNASRYASSRVMVKLTAEEGWARVIVADDGPGVPAEQRQKIFERFYRADASRTGSHAGLGLSIASWIVAEHHGRIVAGDSVMGGAAFLVDLPLLRSS